MSAVMPRLSTPLRAPATRPLWTAALIMASDGLVLVAAGMGAVVLRKLAHGQIDYLLYAKLLITPGLFIAAFAALGLYPGTAISPAEELRRTFLTLTLGYIALAAASFLAKEGAVYSRAAFLLAWLFSVIALPIGRGLVRVLWSDRPWFGHPAIILGAGPMAEALITSLRKHPGLGLKPIAVLDDGPQAQPGGRSDIAGVPLVGRLAMTPVFARELHVPYALVAMPDASPSALLRIVERYGKIFPHLIIIPELFASHIMWASGRDLGGVLGFEVKQRLLLPGPRRAKRAIDLILASLISLIALPLVALLALLIRCTSSGPAFYLHERIGQGGRPFRAWKFRSMVTDAAARLEQHLAAHPELRRQWEEDHKLKDDPRITRMGRFLRRTSLDELPQLINVLHGEMSLIGPRPIVQAEVRRYESEFHLYGRLKPGMTGLWQVSGRNDTSYAERIALDSYYVRNWSVWLDIVILAKTVWVVLRKKGAY